MTLKITGTHVSPPKLHDKTKTSDGTTKLPLIIKSVRNVPNTRSKTSNGSKTTSTLPPIIKKATKTSTHTPILRFKSSISKLPELVPLEQKRIKPFTSHKLSDTLKTEIQDAVRQRQIERYGIEVIEFAKKWGTDDLPTVEAVIKALKENGGSIPDNPEKVYLHRAQRPDDLMNIDLSTQTVKAVPTATAKILDRSSLITSNDANPKPLFITRTSIEIDHKNLTLIVKEKIVPNDELSHHRDNSKSLVGTTRITNVLPGGGLNVLISDLPSIENHLYRSDGDRNIRLTLDQILKIGGKVHTDLTALDRRAVMIQLPVGSSLPYQSDS